jgi:predicted transcriptional regulator
MSGTRPERRGHGELEAEVAVAVAAAGHPVTVHDIQQSVDAGLSYTAVHTILNRLVAKELVELVKTGRTNAYQPALRAAHVVARQMDALLQRGPSRAAVLQSFLRTLTEEDAGYLRAWLDELDTPDGVAGSG